MMLHRMWQALPNWTKVQYQYYRRRQQGSGTTFFSNFFGERLRIYDGDFQSRDWYGAGWTDKDRGDFSALAALPIPRDGLVFNLGAHQGIVSLLLRRKVVPSGRVVAVEMDPLNARFLKYNLEQNDEHQIVVENVAVADSYGRVTHWGGSNNGISLKKHRFFPFGARCLGLANLIEDHGIPDLVYCDIEGAEVLVFKGADDLISRIPYWFVELHGDTTCAHFGRPQRFVVDCLRRRGFIVSIAENEAAPFVPIEDIELTPDRCFLLARRPDDSQALRTRKRAP